ncbi:MAG: ATP-binding protein [Nanoarchaeota archaeon]|nr:ATP-binding protein [Nanoarchaeota archaeon]
MAEKEFYNRKNELKFLQEKYANLSPSNMLVLYGRRRVGKTELVKQFLKNIKNKFYFYVEVTQKSEILNYLSKAVEEQLGDKTVFKDFYEFLNYIGEKADKESFVLVIDEFQRFLDIAPEYISSLQNAWDSKLKNKKMFVLLLGSSIGMIQKIMNSKAGALYGRAQKIKISPFKYSDFRLMFEELSEEEKVSVYSVFGGTPDYLDKFKKSKGDIHDRIFDLVLKKGSILFEEPKNLLEYENVRIHAKYNAILGATSSGKETMKEIQDVTHIPSQTMPAYLNRLDELLDLVGRKDPVLGKERLGRYQTKDNFFKFWYKFILPNQTSLNLGNTKLVSDIIKENLNGYVGRVFEDVAKELLILYNTKEIKGLKLNFENIGSWWDRNGNELDILAYNLKEKSFLLGEVKWTNKQLDADVVNELYRKSKLINYGGNYKFLFISKNGFTQNAIRRMEELKAVYLDLKDVEELFDKA